MIVYLRGWALTETLLCPEALFFIKKLPCSHCGRPVIAGWACKQPNYGLMVCTPVAVKEVNF